jgi:hypothetical protein
MLALIVNYLASLSDPGATRFAALGACPWLPYLAPLALHWPFIPSLLLDWVQAHDSEKLATSWRILLSVLQ